MRHGRDAGKGEKTNMQLPNHPFMLLSFVNTQLRDNCPSLDDFAKEFDTDKEEIIDKLGSIGFIYNIEMNKFVSAN